MAHAPTVFTQAPPVAPGELQVHAPGESGWLSPAQVAALTPEIVRERVATLRPMIAEHAGESERLGYPHPDVWDALRATGFFYHFVPRCYGGCEFGPEDFFITARLIAEACASTGWATTFTVEHNWIAALYPKEAQDKFFAGGRYMIAPAVSTPPGMAARVEGGYRLTAHWKWGSGVMHSNWCIGMAVVPGEADAPPTTVWMAFPLSEAKVLDSWYVSGLAATGSNDIVVDDLFVPDHMVVTAADLQFGKTPGSKIHDHPMYRMPSTAFLALVTSAPTIGAARGAVNIFRDKLKLRKMVGTQTVLGDKANFQVMLARADLMVRTAEMLLQSLARDVLDRAAKGQNADVPARMASAAQNAYASHLARDAIRLILDNAGSSVHMLSEPLQRMARDANVACGHLIQDFEQLAEQHGRSMLGLPPITYFF
jgi:3-hydroxy-9,10-secoandrosta-1,3,5(10)-triene-9,17-dione monooxygenase